MKGGEGRTFYAVGGTWRALAQLHMAQIGYPLHVMHGYVIRAKEALEFSRLVRRVHPDTLSQIEVVNSARRPLLPYAALVLEHIVREAEPREVVFSALGVREGLLYSLLDAEERKKDALLAAAQELNLLRSRSPQHGEELIDWTDAFMATSGIDENAEEKRLRHAACLVADIGWRAHPDYRGEQSLNIIAHAAFVGIDHPGRAYIALAIFFRHVGLLHDEELSPRIRELASTRTLDRARVLGAALRVAYMVSASQPGVLPRAPLKVERHRLVLRLEGETAALAGERVSSRLKQLARLVGREPVVDDAEMADEEKLRSSASGSWSRSCTRTRRPRRMTPIMGDNPRGYQIATPDGRWLALATPAGRTAPATDEERAQAFRTMIGYSGRYRVEGSTITTKVDVAWNESWVGGEQVRHIRFAGDKLFIESPPMPHPNMYGKTVRVIVVWQRDGSFRV